MSAAEEKKSHIPHVVNFKLKPIRSSSVRNNLKPKEVSEEECAIEKKKYHYDSLNPKQREIYKYVHKHPNDIVLIQALPGTGKTFTLKTIAYSWKNPVNVIIFKHDLLYEFRFAAVRHTVTKFFMDMFHLSFNEYKRLESELSRDFNSFEFLMTIVDMLSTARMPDFMGSLVILDEYTVVPKPLFLILLMLLKHYKICTILCGNKYQLQNIVNSKFLKSCSSYNIANYFTDELFDLGKDIRCSDKRYNAIVEYISELSSDKLIDDFARSIIVALFHKQVLFGTSSFTDTHVAFSHVELTNTAHELVEIYKHGKSFYKDENGEILLPENGKFLGYLPLAIGSTYYVDNRSEGNKAKLERVGKNYVDMRFENGVLVTKHPIIEDIRFSAIFKDHIDYLQNGNSATNICNFPIYPANFLTMYKSQGREIDGDLDIILGKTTYQGLCVALSRVQNPSQVVRVVISNPLDYLVSCVINFEELVDPNFIITKELLQIRMEKYKYYKLNESTELSKLVRTFFEKDNSKDRQDLRQSMLEKVSNLDFEELNPPIEDNLNNPMVLCIRKNIDIFLGLACLEEIDRQVWLCEFIKCNPATFPDDRDDLHVINELTDDDGEVMVYATTAFRKDVYNKYKNAQDNEISTQWLVDMLKKSIWEHRDKEDRKVNKRPAHLEEDGNKNEKKKRI